MSVLESPYGGTPLCLKNQAHAESAAILQFSAVVQNEFIKKITLFLINTLFGMRRQY